MFLLFTLSAQAMDFVPVGDAGNEPDPVYGYGAVPYVFEIGKYEITNEDYCEFLNAAASAEDPYGLYNPNMTTGLFGGIDRIGEGFPCEYRPKPEWARRPVVYVGWYDLARMANWLHYGKTEGTDTEGAYDTRAFPKSPDELVDPGRLPQRRNAKALFWIPSEDEWYKAAYFDPALYGERRYYDYPVRTWTTPENVPPEAGSPHAANFFLNQFSLGKPYFLSEAGSYTLASSYYATHDQGGNVWEWVENWRRNDTGWRDAEPTRGLRGGSCTYSFVGLHASNTDPGNPSHEMFVIGGRLARAAKDERGQYIFAPEPVVQEKTLLQEVSDKATRKRLLVAGLAGGFFAGLLVGWWAKRKTRTA
ncbi:MAG: SUMF1/EgtB/PvdO family nonheme iron enzyme [FCB group bacterium]|nr:SUMF1/EgtB/PvdO family nonheme iron enzyme [FCB group bacterium]